jgi:hypothetical protein
MDEFAIAPTDCMDHTQYADSLLHRLNAFPNGTAVMLRGDWGRGKTDVLHRVARGSKQDSSSFAATIVFNPWTQPSSDLLTPLLEILIDRFERSRTIPWDKVLEQAQVIVRFSIALGVRFGSGTDLSTTDMALNSAVAAADHLIEKAKAATTGQRFRDSPPNDPARGFRTLLELLLEDRPEKRVLICIDDLDRCPPNQQVQCLEAFHVLRGSGAAAVYLFAADTRILGESIRAHYGSRGLDPEAYLDKIFDYSQDLLLRTGRHPYAILKLHLDQTPPGLNASVQSVLREKWFRHTGEFIRLDTGIPERALTARNLIRVAKRLEMLARSQPPQVVRDLDDESLQALWIWVILTQYWPSLRSVFKRAATAMDREREVQARAEAAKPPVAGAERGRIINAPFPPALEAHFAHVPEVLEPLKVLHHQFASDRVYGAAGRWHSLFNSMRAFDELFSSAGL